MKKIYLASFLALSLCISAQKGKVYPLTIGETLDGKSMTLPIKNGKHTVVAMVFSRKAEDDLKKWLNPLYSTFMDKSAKKHAMDMTSSYDVNFVFVPMIAGMKLVREEFKSTTDKGFWPYIMDTDKSDMKLHQKLMEISDSKIPYIMVLDKDGKIVEIVSGAFSEDKMEKLEEACGGD